MVVSAGDAPMIIPKTYHPQEEAFIAGGAIIPSMKKTYELPEAATAIWLSDHAAEQGDTVFIPAAAGGVGSFMVQLAKGLGAGRVIASGRAPTSTNASRMRRAIPVPPSRSAHCSMAFRNRW